MTLPQRFTAWLAQRVLDPEQLAAASRLAATTVRIDDSPGWTSLIGHTHDRDAAEIQELYADTLTAWRKNPLAKRIIDITSDYVLGDGISLSSPFAPLDQFIADFWAHRQNQLDLRLPTMVEELSRAGDLFPILFTNPGDGMSYIRFVTKDQVQQIVTAPNDWETELTYITTTPDRPDETRTWRSPAHPEADRAGEVMLHFSINRPIGALLGESDLTSMIPWLLRYSRMLEDRVRLNWAVRAFLWFVTVPSNKVAEKREQYRNPPEAGSIIVKDDAESWDVKAPLLRAADAQHDLTAVRRMIDAGSGFPPHWRGEPENATLATAEAMQAPAERHLKRRQLTILQMLEDIILTAYNRAARAGARPPLPNQDPRRLFTRNLPDITRTDNRELAQSAGELSRAYQTIIAAASQSSPSLTRRFLANIFKFMGDPLMDNELDTIMSELPTATKADATTAPLHVPTDDTRRC